MLWKYFSKKSRRSAADLRIDFLISRRYSRKKAVGMAGIFPVIQRLFMIKSDENILIHERFHLRQYRL